MKKLTFAFLLMSTLFTLFCCKSAQAPKDNSSSARSVAGRGNANAPHGGVIGCSYIVRGTVAQPLVDITVELESDGKVTVKRVISGRKFETIRLGQEVLDSLTRIVVEEDVLKWKESYYPPKDMMVLDGESWNYSVTFKDGTIFSSHGSNAWPKTNGLRRTQEYINSLKKK